MRLFSYFRALLAADHGSSLVEVALTLPFLLLILAGAVDFGQAYHLTMEMAGAAHAGAEYGAQNPTDTTGITTAAQKGAPNVPNLTVTTPTYGCECSDGTSFSANCTTIPSCTSNVVYRVTVRVSATYKPLVPWVGVPYPMSLSSSATMREGGA
ncbi:TadE/TadG family type IV pilus assembly protein [Acidicapsa dinghuensis]|uniref:TadE/TadG family type IV pilus assembly protein n=1 Tax=Acidicapsa dinghuensis TaxID=2218256 RepID=A0ABW1EC58_9BACT|nr:TadE/TadG family type IV pilus assembly protein [Acidicapsa dinghuensis]